MPKNQGMGGKNKKRGKDEAEDVRRELVFKECGEEYGQVTRMRNGRCETMCTDGTKRLAHIRGKMDKKVRINAGDIILVELRYYQDEKADVILKYTREEARLLKAEGELPENLKLGGMDDDDDDDDVNNNGGAIVLAEDDETDNIRV